jgi:Fe-S cluster biosynthesis and repair protein YggX
MPPLTCRRCSLEKNGLDSPPFNDELGRLLHAGVCADCWKEWQEAQIKLINEHRLSLGNPKSQEFLMGELKSFFGLDRS